MPSQFTANPRRRAASAFSSNPRIQVRAVGLVEASQAEIVSGTAHNRYVSPYRISQYVTFDDDLGVTIPKNNTIEALTLTTPNPGTAAYDSSPIAALKIASPASATTRNFETGLWVQTNGSAIDKGRGILLENLGSSDGFCVINSGASGTGIAVLQQSGNTNGTGMVIGTTISSHTGLVVRQETAISATANGTLALFEANGAVTEMVRFGSTKDSQVGLIFRLSGANAAPLIVRNTADSASVIQFNNAGNIQATLYAPMTDDAAALGTTALRFSDLFLASGAVINFNNGTLTLTQSGTTLDLFGTLQTDALRIDQTPTAVGTGTKTISNAADGSTNFGHYISINANGTTYYIPCSSVAPT